MIPTTCPSCEMPNPPGSASCHACGARLAAHDEADGATGDPGTAEAESELWAARNRLSDLEWKVRGAGTVAVATAVMLYLAFVGDVPHPLFGGAVSCGSPLGAQLGSYESAWSPTMWDGCAAAASDRVPLIVGTSLLGLSGLVVLVIRAVRLASARSRVTAALDALRGIRHDPLVELDT